MENVKVVKVPNEVSDFIESLDYECKSRQDVIAFMISNNMDIKSDSFKQYQKELSEYTCKFNCAKNQFEKDYVKPDETGAKKWTLDYNTKEVTIEL